MRKNKVKYKKVKYVLAFRHGGEDLVWLLKSPTIAEAQIDSWYYINTKTQASMTPIPYEIHPTSAYDLSPCTFGARDLFGLDDEDAKPEILGTGTYNYLDYPADEEVAQ